MRQQVEDDCPNCGGEGELYRGNSPYPEAPCTRCGGRWTNTKHTTWQPGSGTIWRTQWI